MMSFQFIKDIEGDKCNMIRQADLKDIDKLSILRVEHQKAEAKEKYNCNDIELQNNARIFFEKHLNHDYFCFMKEIDNEIIATAAVQVVEYLPLCTNLSGKIGYISNVYTKEAFRKKGIQKELMKQCIDFIKSKDIRKAELGSSNPIARHLYKNFGFYSDKNAMKADLELR